MSSDGIAEVTQCT